MHVKIQNPDHRAPEMLMMELAKGAKLDDPQEREPLERCMAMGHWSVFEHSFMTVEITTTLDIATQILRHRSFCFQQLSRRYAGQSDAPVTFTVPYLRSPHPKNRQASLDELPERKKQALAEEVRQHLKQSKDLYERLLSEGVAKECARSVLPQATETVLYMTGSVRSWLHYIALRCAPGTQPEHWAIANALKQVFRAQYPMCCLTAEAMDWKFI